MDTKQTTLHIWLATRNEPMSYARCKQLLGLFEEDTPTAEDFTKAKLLRAVELASDFDSSYKWAANKVGLKDE